MTAQASGTADVFTSDAQRFTPPEPEGIAIVGMDCIFPGAPDLGTYWTNIVGGVDAVGDPPPEWGADIYFDAESTSNDRVYCRRGGWLGDLSRFDALAHKVMPTSVDGGEPDQFLALEVASRALRDAGGAERIVDRARAGIIIGRGTYINRGFSNVIQHGVVIDQTLRLLAQLHPEHTADELDEIRRELKSSLPPFNAEMAPGLVPNVMSGRIANRLDLMGPNYTVDAACASSLLAVDLAMQELRAGRCDVMLAGGVHASTPAPILQIFCQLEALSRAGQIRPFDERADGTLLGEGLGFVVLKRCADADRDHDRVYAVIRSVGVASDGRALGLLAPRVEGEQLALRRAYEAAGVDPRTVELVEAHGTGTPVGDAAEVAALSSVFGGPEAAGPTVALGTVKSMISHLIPASGMAGLIKTALALHHRVLPPTLHCEQVNPALGLAESRFYLNTETRPWIHGGETPRRAGVDSFGFGGINAHALLEEHPNADAVNSRLGPEWPAEVVVLDAASRSDLRARCAQLAADLDPDVPLSTIAAASVSNTSGDPAERLAIVASSIDDLREKLARAGSALADPGRSRLWGPVGIYYVQEPLGRDGRLALTFPGEGSQYPGMLAETAMAFPAVRRWFDLVDRAFATHRRGFPPSRAVFPPPNTDSDQELLWRMDVGPETLFAASQGLLALLQQLGLRADAAVGHSSGEWSALVAAGAISVADEQRTVDDVVRLNRLYERLSVEGLVPRATLLTVGTAEPDLVQEILAASGGRLQLTMDNCPHQVVLCGDAAAVAGAATRLRAGGAVCEELPFDRAYHTPAFAPFAEQVRLHLDSMDVHSPQLHLYSCSTSAPVPPDPEAVRDVAARQWAQPVRFRQTVESMYADGVRMFIEVGPRANLTAFVDDALRGRAHLAGASDSQHGGLTQLQHLVAQLMVHRVPLQASKLHSGRVAPSRTPTGRVLATELPSLRLSGDFLATRLTTSALPAPEVSDASVPPTAVESPRQRVMQAHLRLMEQFLDGQTTVVQAALGKAPASTARLSPNLVPVPPAEHPLPPAPLPERLPSAVTLDARPAVTARTDGPPVSVDDLSSLLRTLLHERTGYPEELLSGDLDLEGDLGIDSIKRVEILGLVQQSLGPLSGDRQAALRRLRTLPSLAATLAEFYQKAEPERKASPEKPTLPYLDEILELAPGRLVARCTWDVEVDRCLRDHTIERQAPSWADPHLVGLPVVPLTCSIELLAEAAVALRGAGVVTEVNDIAAHRWTTLDDGARTVRVTAQEDPASRDILVRIEEEEPGASGRRSPLVTASVRVDEAYPDPGPEPGQPGADVAATGAGEPEAFYGPDGLFHGPCFQVVRSVDSLTPEGASARLVTRGGRDLLGGRKPSTLCTDPALLDGPGQVLAYWLSNRGTTGRDIFPARVASLRLYGLPVDEGRHDHGCAVRVRELDQDRLLADLDLTDASGRLVASFVGWEVVRMELPERLRSFLGRPAELYLSEPWTAPGANGIVGRRLELPPMLADQGGLWLRVLAHAVLAAEERADWRRLAAAPSARRIEWLAGRIAAKEAVRSLLDAPLTERVAASDVRIRVSASGQPRVASNHASLAVSPQISIAHSEGVAIAIAADGTSTRGVGLDSQRVGSVAREVEEIAFTDAERQLLDAAPVADRPRWAARLWTAKEAAGKAVGSGLPLPPSEVEVTITADPETSSSLAVRVPLADGSVVQLEVTTDVVDDIVYATCVCAADVLAFSAVT